MSGNSNRLPVVPTVTVLQVIKNRLIGATKGHQLLKKKADALTMRYRQILKEIVDAKEGMGDKMKGSFFSLAEAKYAAGDNIKNTIFDNVERATLKVYASQDNVAGVKIPKFESVSEPGETKMDLTGGARQPARGAWHSCWWQGAGGRAGGGWAACRGAPRAAVRMARDPVPHCSTHRGLTSRH